MGMYYLSNNKQQVTIAYKLWVYEVRILDLLLGYNAQITTGTPRQFGGIPDSLKRLVEDLVGRGSTNS